MLYLQGPYPRALPSQNPQEGSRRGISCLKGLRLSVQGAGDPKEKNDIQVLTESKRVWRGKDLGVRVLCV